MRNDPIENDLLREAMEAYRPGTDDLGDPQFAVLARQLAADPHVAARLEKLGRLDAAVRESLQDVPVPAGLSAVIVVALTTVTLVAAVGPKSTAVAPVKPVPLIVTNVPPDAGPLVGLIPVTVGATGAVSTTLSPA